MASIITEIEMRQSRLRQGRLRIRESGHVGRTSGRPGFFGDACDGRRIFVVYEEVFENAVYVVTAYEV